MTEIAREAGLGRESLYKALSPEGNPEFCHRPESRSRTRLEAPCEGGIAALTTCDSSEFPASGSSGSNAA